MLLKTRPPFLPNEFGWNTFLSPARLMNESFPFTGCHVCCCYLLEGGSEMKIICTIYQPAFTSFRVKSCWREEREDKAELSFPPLRGRLIQCASCERAAFASQLSRVDWNIFLPLERNSTRIKFYKPIESNNAEWLLISHGDGLTSGVFQSVLAII